MARYAPAALVAALLVAAGLAFLHTESLKLETSPIRQTRVTKLFSPVCKCNTSKARIAFRLSKPDIVSITIVDSSGSDVRRLVSERPSAGRVAALWNGRDDEGAIVRNGFYRARVRLDLREKTFALPNPIRVDKRAPRLEVVSVKPRVFSPDGDRRNDRVTVRYTVDEAARGVLYVDGVQRVLGASTKPAGELRWFGMIGARSLPAGSYALSAGAVDLAGNRAVPVAAGPVRIRYVELPARVIRVKAGSLIRVHVLTDARRVQWRLAGRTGVGRPPVFRIRAPQRNGRFRLFVTANGHGSAAAVVVTGA